MQIGYKVDCRQIKKQRICKGMTQIDLAKATNISVGAVHYLETGKTTPSPKTLKRICDELGLMVEDVMEVN